MTIKTVAYSKTYPIANLGVWEKIYLEATINEGEDVRQCLYDLKKQVENFHYESNEAAEKQKEAEEKPSLTKVADLIKEINFCKDAATLEKTYVYIAKTDADIQAAYDKKMDEFGKAEAKFLIEAYIVPKKGNFPDKQLK